MTMHHEQVDNVVDLAATIASKAEDIEDIFVLYTLRSDGKAYSMDNGLTVAEANFLVDKFKYWMFFCMAGGDP